jgi:23S rRNA (cytidine2498-2'-O)-methyltransferase
VIHTILTCSPHFTDLALNEIRRYHPQTIASQYLSPGHILLEAPCSYDEFVAPWQHRLPIYLHHLFPVDSTVKLDADLTPLKHVSQTLAPPDVTVQVRSLVETEPYSLLEIQRCLSGKMCGANLLVPQGQVLSVLVVPEGTGVRAYVGVSWANQNLSPWPGGQIPITESVSNRAGYKLLEALSVFSIQLRKGDQALDLGASPGAWTTLLRHRGLRVTAVAPAPLYPWLAFDKGVTYEPLRAEDYLQRCRTIFDLIVNDMYLDARESAQLMVEYARHLRREGIAIMTLKLAERNRRRVMDHSYRILRNAYKIIRVRQLVSNRKEVTLFLRRKV